MERLSMLGILAANTESIDAPGSVHTPEASHVVPGLKRVMFCI